LKKKAANLTVALPFFFFEKKTATAKGSSLNKTIRKMKAISEGGGK
jgi:hypothetical protein